jgi:uncharacterized membrane protein
MNGWSDERIERIVGKLLQAGVLLSTSVVLIGGILYVLSHGSEVPHYQSFEGEPEQLRTLKGILHETLAFRARGIIQLGLLLLIATPVARVAFSAAAFAAARDRLYVTIATMVFVILICSLVWGQS